MPKSQDLNFTQRLTNAYVDFFNTDLLRVVAVSPNAVGTNLTAGTRTFTAAAGTIQTGGQPARWTATVSDGRVVGQPMIIEPGSYYTTPTAISNAATVDTGSTNATWGLRAEMFKELYTASENDAVVKSINVVSFDSAARVMGLWVISTDNQPVLLGAVNIPARSGDSGTVAAIDLLGGTLMPGLPYDANGKRVLPLKAGQRIAVSVPTVGGGVQINVTAMIEEY
jgi:hypothetical protein